MDIPDPDGREDIFMCAHSDLVRDPDSPAVMRELKMVYGEQAVEVAMRLRSPVVVYFLRSRMVEHIVALREAAARDASSRFFRLSHTCPELIPHPELLLTSLVTVDPRRCRAHPSTTKLDRLRSYMIDTLTRGESEPVRMQMVDVDELMRFSYYYRTFIACHHYRHFLKPPDWFRHAAIDWTQLLIELIQRTTDALDIKELEPLETVAPELERLLDEHLMLLLRKQPSRGCNIKIVVFRKVMDDVASFSVEKEAK
jgi:hypothetical protein